jgi:hypothetical protein
MAQSEPAASAHRAARDAERAALTWLDVLFRSRGWHTTRSSDSQVDVGVELPGAARARFEVEVKVVDELSAPVRLRLASDRLRRWVESRVPVVLVARSRSSEDARWDTARAIARRLDADPGWQNKRMVTVTLPADQRLDAAGLDGLRDRVLEELGESIGRVAAMTLRFEDTPAGLEALARFQRGLRAGVPVKIDGKDARLLYSGMPEDAAWVQPSVIEVNPAPKEFSMRFEIHRDGSLAARLEAVMVVTRAGESTSLKTKESAPVTIQFGREQAAGGVDLSVTRGHRASMVDDELRATRFMLAGARGGELVVYDDDTPDPETGLEGRVVLKTKLDAQPAVAVEALVREHAIFAQLAFAQRALAGRLRIAKPFDVPEEVTAEDAVLVERLVKIVRDGKVRGARITLSFRIDPARMGPVTAGEVSLRMKSELTLFGVDIDLGDVSAVVVDSGAFQKRLREAAAEGDGRVKFDDLVVDETYLDWQPSTAWKSLVELATQQGGYILERQLEETGSTELDVEVAIANGELERVAGPPRALHLTSIPESEDAELWRIWLETDKLGVFSHETALERYDLSDVMPNRIHVTMPESVDLDLPRNVVVHVAEIPETDRTWSEDLPFTTASRTVRDCRADHLSLEFVEQAERQGIARGLFSASDLVRS